jgi:hypothetical protein
LPARTAGLTCTDACPKGSLIYQQAVSGRDAELADGLSILAQNDQKQPATT